MPAVLALRDKKTGQHIEDRRLIEVDELICAHLGIAVDPIDFARNWVDNIGFRLSIGTDFETIKKSYEGLDEQKMAITQFLDDNYFNASYRA